MFNFSEYEININFEKQNINRIAWNLMANKKNISKDPHVTDEVCKGWIRSKNFGIDPYQRSASNLLNKKELTNLKKRNDFFLSISKQTLKNLDTHIRGSGFNFAISDKNGILMEVFGDSAEQTKEGNWVPGADWSEKSIGNNGIGTSIYLKKPVFIIGYEHYCRCCHHWASASAPIFDSEKKIIGSIALCGPFEKIHQHTLGMIISAAYDIEMQISILNVLKEREINNEYQTVLLNAFDEGVIGLNTEGTIIFSNQQACEILQVKNEELNSLNIESLLDDSTCSKIKTSVIGVKDLEIIFNINNKFIKCLCSSKNIKDYGSIIKFKDYDLAVKEASKLVCMKPSWTFDKMIGRNKKHFEMVNIAKIAANSDKSILILGESGTGKDVFAQSIHNQSKRKNANYIAINCGAIPKDLIASELFGYAEGAFTGSKKGGNKGKFEVANGGTIFLDEIGEMPLEQQIVLLRVLEDSSFSRVGSSEKIPLNIRIITATNKNIINEIQNNKFRLDLFYRINVFTINTVPLRDRKDDIEELSNSFLKDIARKSNNNFIKLSNEVLSFLMGYDWPGNIRELQNVLERAYAISGDGNITIENIHLIEKQNTKNKIQKVQQSNDLTKFDYDAILLKAELEKNKWNISATSESLNVSRQTIYRWIKKHNIS